MANTLTLLPGAQLIPGKSQKILLMGDYQHLVEEGKAELKDTHGNAVGAARVSNARTTQFAFLGKADFDGQADPQLGSYTNALHRLQTLMPDFSIMDTVTVLDIVAQGGE